jgi:CheY-like chemotaxis protein
MPQAHDISINSVLLAEDNLEHCYFFKKALKETDPDISFTDVHDGETLMLLLESFIPDILFLDLNMPCKDGMQCIGEIRQNKVYDTMPIVVFSISSQNNVMQATYGFGANLYFVKPKEYSALVNSLRRLLSMDWKSPKLITEQYFRLDKYIPFDADVA